MTGTIDGGHQTARTNKKRYGEDFYKKIGRMGGLKSEGGGFSRVPGLASLAGRKGAAGKKIRKQIQEGLQDYELKYEEIN